MLDTLPTAPSATAPVPWTVALFAVLTALVPWLQGLVTVPLLDVIKRHLQWLDRQSPWVKQLVLVLLNAGLAALSALTGLTLPGLSEWNAVTVQAVLASLVASAEHTARKVRAATPPPAEPPRE